MLRRLFKYLPVSIELASAAAIDDVGASGRSQALDTVLDGDYITPTDDEEDDGEIDPPAGIPTRSSLALKVGRPPAAPLPTGRHGSASMIVCLKKVKQSPLWSIGPVMSSFMVECLAERSIATAGKCRRSASLELASGLPTGCPCRPPPLAIRERSRDTSI